MDINVIYLYGIILLQFCNFFAYLYQTWNIHHNMGGYTESLDFFHLESKPNRGQVLKKFLLILALREEYNYIDAVIFLVKFIQQFRI